MSKTGCPNKRRAFSELFVRELSSLCGCILWLTATLSFIRILPGGRGDEPGLPVSAALGWTIAVCLLLSFSTIGRVSSRRFVNAIAGALCILNLPLPWLVAYFVFVMSLEIAKHRASNRASGRTGIQKAEETVSEIESAVGSLPGEEAGEYEDDEETWNEGTTQRTIRCRTEEGIDRFEGTFLVEFRPDQSTASVHVPFCPAFETIPSVDVYFLDEADAKLNVAETQLFGTRIDVKRKASAPTKFPIAVVAEAESAQTPD